MNLESLLKKTDFYYSNKEIFTFRNIKLNVVKAVQRIDNLQYPIIANLFLVELTNENNSILLGKDAYDKFNDFQNKLLCDQFFENKTDIRWNIYLLFVAESKSIYDNIPTNDFEYDDNYARKFFFTVLLSPLINLDKIRTFS